MIEYHPSFETPTQNIVLSRYMEAGQLLSLLTTSKLHFTRLDQFEDKWEGAQTIPNVIALKQMCADNKLPAETEASFLGGPGRLRMTMFVNCWHENEHESAAMWKLYGQYGSNIALITTVEMLRSSMADDQEVKIYCGRVKYIDYRKDAIDPRNAFNYVIHKRKSFSHEREVRLVSMHMPLQKDGPVFDDPAARGGLDIKVDLKKLISAILVSPKAPTWYVAAITEVCEKLGVDKGLVRKSDLDEAPLW